MRAPGQVRVFAVGEEVLIEKFAAHRNIFHHGPTIKRGRSRRAKDVFPPLVLPAIHFVAPAIQMAEIAKEIDSRRIDHVAALVAGAGLPPQQLAAQGADLSFARAFARVSAARRRQEARGR